MATSYLYGDSTPSRLTSNFIDLLRDSLDLSVHLLLADDRIGALRASAARERRLAGEELGRLRALKAAVLRTLDETPKGAPDSPTATAAAAVIAAANDAVRTQEAAVEQDVAARIAKIDADEAAEREGEYRALEALLLRHDPPDTTTTLRLALAGASYAATLEATTPYGLEYALALDVAPAHVFGHAVRLEKLVPHLEVMAPESTGWIRKETKLRPQRLERLYVAGVTVSGATSTTMLRAESDGNGPGFDVTIGPEAPRVRYARVGGDEATDGACDVSDDDAEKLLAFHDKLLESVAELAKARKALASATLGGVAFKELAQTRLLVERLVRAMAPIAQEIARRSLTPTELVLKRLVAGDRREEIFVAKASLVEKLAPLSGAARAFFQPLGLEESRLSAVPPPPASSPVVAPPPPPSAPSVAPPRVEPRASSPAPIADAAPIPAPPASSPVMREKASSVDLLIDLDAAQGEPSVIIDEAAHDPHGRPTRTSSG